MRFSLRTKLALVTLILLAIPFVGYWFVLEMERFLRAGLEQNVAATAKAAAVALHDRPALLERRAPVTKLDVKVEAPPPVVAVVVKDQGDNVPANGVSSPPVFPPGGEGSQPQSSPPLPPGEGLGVTERTAPEAPKASPAETDPKLEIERIVHALDRAESRMWVVNRRGALLAITGSLKKATGRASSGTDGARGAPGGVLDKAQSDYLQPLYARILGNRILPRAPDDFDDTIPAELISGSQEISRALAGVPATAWRSSVDGKATIISAAHPVWNGPEVVAVVVAVITAVVVVAATAIVWVAAVVVEAAV